jgi:hypothetical protein
LVLLGSALLISAGLLVVAAGSDRGIPRGAPRRIKDPQSLAPPTSLGQDEASRAGAPADMRGGMQLDAGGPRRCEHGSIARRVDRARARVEAQLVDDRPLADARLGIA